MGQFQKMEELQKTDQYLGVIHAIDEKSPQSLDRYIYALDNQESSTDPTGSCAVVYDCAATTTTNPVAPTPAPVPAPLGHQRTVSETATTHPHGIRIISSK